MNNTKTRSFNPIDLVGLPVLDASSATALGDELLTRSKGEELPPPIAAAYKQLRRAHHALNEAAVVRYDGMLPTEENGTEATKEWRSAWTAMHRWLGGWAELSDERSHLAPEARRLYEAVFHDGLRFVRLPNKVAWTEASQRLEWLERQNLEESFREVAGREFVEEVKAAQKRLGAVLGIKQIPEVVEAPSIREPLELFRARLRQVVLQVSADADRGDAAAKARAARLLAPLAEWQPSKVRGAKAPSEPEAQPDAAPPNG